MKPLNPTSSHVRYVAHGFKMTYDAGTRYWLSVCRARISRQEDRLFWNAAW